MLTIFSTPKAFEGLFDTLQHNAIASWRALGDDVEILLFGDDPGCREAALEHGATHVPDVARSPQGTPMLDDMFAQAQRIARHRVVCYVNCDIVFLPDLLEVVEVVEPLPHPYLVIGRRTNLDLAHRLDFSAGYAGMLRSIAAEHGELFTAYGIDYFMFPKGSIDDLLPFPVGRALWDNWLVYNTRRKRVPVIDATPDNLVIHQNHDYSHIAGGHTTAWYGVEAQRNRAMVDPDFVAFSVDDATREIWRGEIRRVRSPRRVARHVMTVPALIPGLRRSVRIARAVRRALQTT